MALDDASVLSVAVSSAGSAFWMRCPGSSDLVFGDLMLWGFIRRLRAEKRIACTADLLGEVKLPPVELPGVSLPLPDRVEVPLPLALDPVAQLGL